jgi:flagellar biosynthetic protein FliQ
MGLMAGVMVSIFQAATQINDSALAFIPKILASVLSLIIFGPWMIAEISGFATYTMNLMTSVAN